MAAFYLARYCVIYATARGEQRERGGSELRKGMDGRQPRGKWNADNIWNRLGLGDGCSLVGSAAPTASSAPSVEYCEWLGPTLPGIL